MVVVVVVVVVVARWLWCWWAVKKWSRQPVPPHGQSVLLKKRKNNAETVETGQSGGEEGPKTNVKYKQLCFLVN